MFSHILGALLFLSQVVLGNDTGHTPTDFTATALNSSAIRVSWKEPSHSVDLNGWYVLVLYNSTHEEQYDLKATEDIITDLEPSTTYDLEVSTFWRNGTPVDEYASTSVTTLPRASSFITDSLIEVETAKKEEEIIEDTADSHTSDPEATEGGHTPTDFTATALNSSAIRVSWKEPSRSGDLNGWYDLVVYNITYRDEYDLKRTEDVITDLEPSTTYDLEVSAHWRNGTPVVEYASTSVTTLPRALPYLTDRPLEGEKEDEEEAVDDKEELLSHSHTSDPDAKGGDPESSDGIVPPLEKLSVTDEIDNMANETFSHEPPDQPNSSEVIKGSFISLAGFSLLWLSLMVAF